MALRNYIYAKHPDQFALRVQAQQKSVMSIINSKDVPQTKDIEELKCATCVGCDCKPKVEIAIEQIQ